MLGVIFDAWMLVFTWLALLAEDTLLAVASFYGPMFLVWGIAGSAAGRRSGRLWDGVKAGAIVAFVTFVVLHVALLVRVNLFLDAISQRLDWRDLVARYPDSGFDTLRANANYVYITGVPFKTERTISVQSNGWP